MKKWLLSYFLIVYIGTSIGQNNLNAQKEDYEYFIDLFISNDDKTITKSLNYIDANWSESFEILALESMYLLKNPSHAYQLISLLEKKTGKKFGYDFDKWYDYIWNKPASYTPSYYTFKSKLNSFIDPRFAKYFFNRSQQSTIRLDEVRWGGVVQDGIPPLHNPEMILAKEATYLNNNDVVFGIYINGGSRAYPKRILAWHEMFTDTIGGVPLAGVYCTLCGTVILYKTQKDGVNYQLGTSGFLYRSNKLMYDKKTQSLWNTIWGKPVIGPLVNKNIQLEYLSVVTTTWGEWKKRHPQSKVLSIQTGHKRNYDEGVAYRDYFSTDELMFTVPELDRRLENKQEILAIRLPEGTEENIAISSRFLRRNTIYQGNIDNRNFTVFTDKSGAHRVYFTKSFEFVSYDKHSQAKDSNGDIWELREHELVNINTQESLQRLHSHNAFWFGYKAAFPQVKLVK